MEDPKMTLIKISAESCGPCKAMAKAKTIERFVEKHGNVTFVPYSIADTEGNSDYGEFKAAEKKTRKYGVSVVPTLIFEGPTGDELIRQEGGISLRDLEKLYKEALEVHAEDVAEDADEDEPEDTDEEEEEKEEDDEGK